MGEGQGAAEESSLDAPRLDSSRENRFRICSVPVEQVRRGLTSCACRGWNACGIDCQTGTIGVPITDELGPKAWSVGIRESDSTSMLTGWFRCKKPCSVERTTAGFTTLRASGSNCLSKRYCAGIVHKVAVSALQSHLRFRCERIRIQAIGYVDALRQA
jgi:hypothetical protein